MRIPSIAMLYKKAKKVNEFQGNSLLSPAHGRTETGANSPSFPPSVPPSKKSLGRSVSAWILLKENLTSSSRHHYIKLVASLGALSKNYKRSPLVRSRLSRPISEFHKYFREYLLEQRIKRYCNYPGLISRA